MLIIDLQYQKPLDEVEKHLAEHRAFLGECYAKGYLLASGPKSPRTGGVIVALADEPVMREVLARDPFQVHGVATYTYTTFDPVKTSEAFGQMLVDLAGRFED